MKYTFVIVLSFFANLLQAQVFIEKGLIEYQVVVNNHKAMGEGTWAEMFKDKIPKLSTSYYQLTFDSDKSIYLFNRKDEKTKSPWMNDNGEDNIWYNDYSTEKFIQQKMKVLNC